MRKSHIDIWESLILIYEIILGWLLLVEGLEKISQLGWFGVLTILSPSLLEKLGMV